MFDNTHTVFVYTPRDVAGGIVIVCVILVVIVFMVVQGSISAFQWLKEIFDATIAKVIVSGFWVIVSGFLVYLGLRWIGVIL